MNVQNIHDFFHRLWAYIWAVTEAEVHEYPFVLKNSFENCYITFFNLQMVLCDDVIGSTVDQCPIAPANIDIMCITPLFFFLKIVITRILP